VTILLVTTHVSVSPSVSRKTQDVHGASPVCCKHAQSARGPDRLAFLCRQNVGAIVAGSIGAVVLLVVIGGVVIVFVRRRRQTTKALEFKEMKKEVPFENMPGQDMNPPHAVY
jgi:hypothetical protein